MKRSHFTPILIYGRYSVGSKRFFQCAIRPFIVLWEMAVNDIAGRNRSVAGAPSTWGGIDALYCRNWRCRGGSNGGRSRLLRSSGAEVHW